MKIVPELSLRHDPKLFYFVSTPTIDIEPIKNAAPTMKIGAAPEIIKENI